MLSIYNWWINAYLACLLCFKHTYRGFINNTFSKIWITYAKVVDTSTYQEFLSWVPSWKMNIIHLWRCHCCAGGGGIRWKNLTCIYLSFKKWTTINFQYIPTYLNISGVSLEDGQTQHQKKELLSESALHNTHLCVHGSPEQRKYALLRSQRCFL